MSRLVLHRENNYVNRMRSYKIYLDGTLLDTISNGKSKEIEIPDGTHSLQAKMDWCSSPPVPFEVGQNATATFKISGYKHSNWLVWVVLAIIFIHLALQYFFHISWLLWFVVPFAFLNIYYVTLGRKQYLTLKQVEN